MQAVPVGLQSLKDISPGHRVRDLWTEYDPSVLLIHHDVSTVVDRRPEIGFAVFLNEHWSPNPVEPDRIVEIGLNWRHRSDSDRPEEFRDLPQGENILRSGVTDVWELVASQMLLPVGLKTSPMRVLQLHASLGFLRR